MLRRVSIPSPTAVSVVRFAVTANEAPEKSTVSTPLVPSRVLSFASPIKVSSPLPVVTFSISLTVSTSVPSVALPIRRETLRLSASEE